MTGYLLQYFSGAEWKTYGKVFSTLQLIAEKLREIRTINRMVGGKYRILKISTKPIFEVEDSGDSEMLEIIKKVTAEW